MGWNSGGDIFDPVCTQLVRALKREDVTERGAEVILMTLIGALQSHDWDTESDSLGVYAEHAFVRRAFKRHGIVSACYDTPPDAEAQLCVDGDFCMCEQEVGHLSEGEDHRCADCGRTWKAETTE